MRAAPSLEGLPNPLARQSAGVLKPIASEASMENEDIQQLRELLRTHQSRLHVFELQQAQKGDNTPPEVTIEMERIRDDIAELQARIAAATPAPARAILRQTRQQALKAFYADRWAEAEELLCQVLEEDPDDVDARAKLKEAQRQLDLEAMYLTACSLRDDGHWEAVLEALADLDRQMPGHPDPQGLRAWAAERARETRPAPPSPGVAAPAEPAPERAAPAATPPAQAASGPAADEALLQVVRSFPRHDGLYIHPSIPAEKLANAAESCGLPEGEQALALIDCTVMGSAKNALIFGRQGVYYHNDWTGKQSGTDSIPYADFPNREFKDEEWFEVTLGNGQYLNVSGSSVPKDRIVEMLNRVKQHLEGGS